MNGFNYGILMNPFKTRLIVLRIDWTQLSDITLNGTPLPICSCVKNLGIYIEITKLGASDSVRLIENC